MWTLRLIGRLVDDVVQFFLGSIAVALFLVVLFLIAGYQIIHAAIYGGYIMADDIWFAVKAVALVGVSLGVGCLPFVLYLRKTSARSTRSLGAWLGYTAIGTAVMGFCLLASFVVGSALVGYGIIPFDEHAHPESISSHLIRAKFLFQREPEGRSVAMPRITSARPKLRACIEILFISLLCASWARNAFSQNLRTLTIFDWYNGAYPHSSLIQGKDGNFYGTTIFGGTQGCGTLYRITPNGSLTTLHSFSQTDGCGIYGTLILATDGNLHGTTAYGGIGAYDNGTVFRVTPNGVITTLYTFCRQANCWDGIEPYAGLIEASDGKLYGTTSMGGVGCVPFGCGTIFRITKQGVLTTLHRFSGADGYGPRASLSQASDGMLYGAAAGGGDFQCVPPYGCGTIFKIALGGGELITLHQFTGEDGDQPWSRLMQASMVNFTGPQQPVVSLIGVQFSKLI